MSEAGSEGGGQGDAGDGGAVCNETVCGGQCVNVQIDPDNCGTCGHGCQGGTCSAGTCQPVTLGTAGSGNVIAVDSHNVYWGGSQIYTVSIFGGAVTMITPTPRTMSALTSDGQNLYWTDTTGSVYTCAVTGCTYPPTKLSDSNGNVGEAIGGIAVDANNLYWTTNGGVFTCAKGTCSTATTALFASSTGSALTLDSTAVYWTTGTSVLKCAKAGCPSGIATQLVPQGAAPGATYIAVDATNVYWTSGTSSVQECSRTTCLSPTTLAAGGVGAGVTADGVNAYFIGSGLNTIDRCAVGGCSQNPTILASGPGTGETAIASDATSIYWLSETSATVVVKLAK